MDHVWEQEPMDAITHAMTCHIHFHFRDGSKLRDVVLDAGVFRKKKHAENEDTWIAYLAAWK